MVLRMALYFPDSQMFVGFSNKTNFGFFIVFSARIQEFQARGRILKNEICEEQNLRKSE
jgi:hypothetical protein